MIKKQSHDEEKMQSVYIMIGWKLVKKKTISKAKETQKMLQWMKMVSNEIQMG
jgi:hypothetical protein